jgi:hypothetical protein
MIIVRCASCYAMIPDRLFREGGVIDCPACARRTRSILLPSLYKAAVSPTPPKPPEPPGEGETACFYDPARKATQACDHCGVFVSDAWAAKWGTQTVCLKCLDQLRSKTKDQRYEGSRTLWDNVALGSAVGPYVIALMLSLTFFGLFLAVIPLMFTLVAAPIAIFVALRFWSAPRSLVPRGPLRLILALVFSGLTLTAWVIGFVMLVESATH